MKVIIEILDEMEDRPELSVWNHGICHLAAAMLRSYTERRGLNIWDSAARIGKITESDLLDGAKDWRQQSRDGNYLIYDEDICRLLCNRRDRRRTCYGRLPPGDQENWLDFQGQALEQAARIVMDAVNQ